MFEHENIGIRWGIIFLRTASYLPHDEVDDLVMQAIRMYAENEDEKPVMGLHYEGRLCTRRQLGVLGSFTGIVFYAELETDKGRDHMEILISEQTPSRRLSYSKN